MQSLDTPELAGLLGSVVLPAVASTHPAVRLGGVRSLGLCCLLDSVRGFVLLSVPAVRVFCSRAQLTTVRPRMCQALVRVHAPLLVQAVRGDVLDIQIAAAKALGDILTVYGRQVFQPVSPGGDAPTDDETVSYDNAVDALTTVAADGVDASLSGAILESLARLMLVDRISSDEERSRGWGEVGWASGAGVHHAVDADTGDAPPAEGVPHA